MIETGIIAAAITAAIYTVRANAGAVAAAWGQARWYQRCILLICLLPIPGPVDEIVALLVIRRIRRTNRKDTQS